MNISLREYNKQIEDLVENSQVEEAVAHCRHILKEFPLHADTRRLLGSAYLDARKYALAKDIFLQVLLAIPADFVANLGMSFIYTIEGDMEYAIWHLERAYEKNPNNIGIQDELKKLYTLRDGRAPDRINKTDGVLAYLYFNSGEYQKAESIIKQILLLDVTRREMKTLLARIYYQQGRLEQAAETSLQCLEHSLYNLEANRIMVKILQQSSNQQDIEIYRHRLQELDPYAIHPDSWLLAEELFVPEMAIQLGRLDWSPEAFVWEESAPAPEPAPGADASGDAASEGVPVETALPTGSDPSPVGSTQPEPETPAEPVPAWLQDLIRPGESAEGVLDREAGDDVPDWVRQIDPDPEPVIEHVVPEEAPVAEQTPATSQEDQPSEDGPANTSFHLEDWVGMAVEEDGEAVLNDPEIEQVVQQVLQDLPTEQELETLAETQPSPILPNQQEAEGTAPNPTQPTTPGIVDELEMLGDLSATDATTVQAPSTETADPFEQTESAPIVAEGEDAPLPPYNELEWLGDLGHVFIDPTLEETRFSPILPEPIAKPAMQRATPDLPDVSLPAYVQDRPREKPAEETPYEPVVDILPEIEADPALLSAAISGMAQEAEAVPDTDPATSPSSETPDEPIEEIVPEAEAMPIPTRAIGAWVPAFHTEDAAPTELAPAEEPVEELPTEPASQSIGETANEPIEEPIEEILAEDAPVIGLGPGEPDVEGEQTEENEPLTPPEGFQPLPVVAAEEPTIQPEPDAQPETPAEAPEVEEQPSEMVEPSAKDGSLLEDGSSDGEQETSEPEAVIEPEPETLQEPEPEIQPSLATEPEAEPESELDEPAGPQDLPEAQPQDEEPAETQPDQSNELVGSAVPPVEPHSDEPATEDDASAEPASEEPIAANPAAQAQTPETPASPLEAPLGYLAPDAAPKDVPERPAPEPELPAQSLDAVSAEDASIVQAAAAKAQSGDLDEALADLNALILREAALPQVIGLLRELADAHPENPAVWRALGDACFNHDALQQALDAYSKADDLTTGA